MFIPRAQMSQIENLTRLGKVVILYGPRQVGKTTLLKRLLERTDKRYRYYDGQDLPTKELFSSQSIDKFQSALGDLELLVIDEAQHIENIGINLKLIVDHVSDLRIIATGSSSFDLAQKIGEPLTGRKFNLVLYPIAQLELEKNEDYVSTRANLEERLIYGSYPEVITTKGYELKQRLLKEIVNSYLYKDILALEKIHHPRKIADLLQLLAFQIGQEVSMSELGTKLGLSTQTVSRYLDLLEKSFVIVQISGFSRNLRKEVTKSSRYYFYDTGVRNGIVDSFNSLKMRNDVGMLWENYIVAERLKKQEYKKIYTNNYFWRTYDQKEIDWVEERDGKLFGYEIKWGDKKVSAPKDWLETYDKASFKVINRDNYLEFVA